MAQVLQQGLEQEDYSVTLARTGWNGLELAQRARFHAILLDIMLPGIDGFAIARQLRSEGNATPILMVTARDSVEDLVNGFDAGAEDYLRKPFSFLELLARLRSLIQRGGVQPYELRVGDLVMEVSSHEVTRNGQRLSLTKTEYRLLEVMMKHAGHVMSREALVTAVWGEGTAIERNSIDWQVKALRDKIDRNVAERLIHTVRGFGYKLSVAP